MKGKQQASSGAPPASSAATQQNYEEAVALIQREYIDKILDFIRDKEGNKGVSPKDFIKVYEVVMFQCDSMDNGAKLYKFFQEVIKNYINDVALPQVKR